ncbi:TetR/AcrR family transcriptional regulator [Nocardiopsis composta]|uniref:AcrR family transcriptional regulator n=1 Tax=Nocardiopsis composta TaxID=157465 RepID=A0A7W8QQ91_9ACTN|nr:TetR/AcrR family transcriptional regulator [Nocardiopsis composta]MBB5434494.1 AcrR family transcriptional regulator [Nocardiopsis composta]
MGHKEQLLEGAKQCLYAKGYARTTARDIVAASGANLASIGYHYGSKEALLTAAMVDAVGEWADRVTGSLRVERSDPMGRFEEVMNRLAGSYPGARTMVAANFEALAQLDHRPELRDQLVEAHAIARRSLVALVLDTPEEEVAEEQESGLGSLLLALIPGTMAMFLVDPGSTPDGTRLAEGVRSLAGAEARD